MSTTAQPVPAEPPAPKHPIAFVFHFAFKVRVIYLACFAGQQLLGRSHPATDRPGQLSTNSSTSCLTDVPDAVQVAALVFYILCETINKNQFVLNFVVCIVLLAMDFWTVSL